MIQHLSERELEADRNDDLFLWRTLGDNFFVVLSEKRKARQRMAWRRDRVLELEAA